MSKLVTSAGTAYYPQISQPSYKFDENGIYSCKLHVSKKDFEEFSKKVDKLVEKAYQAELAKQGKQKLKRMESVPVRITDDGKYEIYAKQPAKKNTAKGELNFSVAVYDSEGTKMGAETNIGSGSKLRLSVEFAPWYVAAIGFGYTLRLRAAQVIELCEYNPAGDGSADSMGFGKVEGGFVGEAYDLSEDDEESKKDSKAQEVPF